MNRAIAAALIVIASGCAQNTPRARQTVCNAARGACAVVAEVCR